MAEIVGTVSAGLQIAGAAIRVSTELYRMISTMKNAPREILWLSSDIQA